MKLLVLALSVVACGRIGFDTTGDGSVGDGGVRRDRCPAAPRPTTPATTVVGDGTPASCDEASLVSAITAGGHIAFDCGAAPHTIVMTVELIITTETIVDGGGRIILDGGDATRIVRINAAGVPVTFVDLEFAHGRTGNAGGAMLIQNGTVRIIGSNLHDNHGPTSAATDGGGAISLDIGTGSLEIYDSQLHDNASANGGAIQAWGDLTLVETVLTANEATGTGGSTGNGGLGGAVDNSGRGDLTMCGVTMTNNIARNLGGGLHRVCTDSMCIDRIERTAVTANGSVSAGGVYHQAGNVTVSQVSVTNNTASNNVGGMWNLGTSTSFTAENLTVSTNTAGSGLGAGLVVQSNTGSISFSTIANNTCTGGTCAAAAVDPTGGISLRATVIADNVIDAPNAAISCSRLMIDANDNFQWPVVRMGGGSDDPGSLCVVGARLVDPQLAGLMPRTGPRGSFAVATPLPTSPALAIATGCPAEDQLGHPRPTPCSAGAVEP